VTCGDDHSISDRNSVSLCPATEQFTRPNCVQQASISTCVSLTMFDRGWHCISKYLVLFCYYMLGGNTAMVGRLHARLCQAFLVVLFCRLEVAELFSIQQCS